MLSDISQISKLRLGLRVTVYFDVILEIRKNGTNFNVYRVIKIFYIGYLNLLFFDCWGEQIK